MSKSRPLHPSPRPLEEALLALSCVETHGGLGELRLQSVEHVLDLGLDGVGVGLFEDGAQPCGHPGWADVDTRLSKVRA